MRILFTALAFGISFSTNASALDLETIVNRHVLDGYSRLVDRSEALDAAAAADCTATGTALREAYHEAFDAWIRVSHLRFGPSEVDDRAFALAFWPDPRGSTPKTLSSLIRDADPVVNTAEEFATVSVAARGFYALEFLLYDLYERVPENAYYCDLIRAVTSDIALNTTAIHQDWQEGYAARVLAHNNDTYRNEREAAQQFFTALTTGLEFTANMRLGRPLGTFERPRPTRAETRRSERSLRNVILSLEATRELAALVSGGNETVDLDFARALDRAQALDDPIFAGVADPGTRFRVEALQNSVVTAYRTLLEDVGPELGITAGFNSLDGD